VGSKDTVTPKPGEDRVSYLKRWKTKQKQLADYVKSMARAPQRTLDDWAENPPQ